MNSVKFVIFLVLFVPKRIMMSILDLSFYSNIVNSSKSTKPKLAKHKIFYMEVLGRCS